MLGNKPLLFKGISDESYAKPPLFKAISCQSNSAFYSQTVSIHDSNEQTNELAEAFLAFVQGRCIESSQVLTNLIVHYEANFEKASDILPQLYALRSECKSRFGKFESARLDRLESVKADGDVDVGKLQRMVSVCLMDNGDTQIIVEGKRWNITASRSAKNTVNPIRRIVDRCILMPCLDKPTISLSIGDPTRYGNMLPPIEASKAINESFLKPTSHGYTPSCGTDEARAAVAKLCSRDGFVLDAKDIILTSGCSHALEMCINCVAEVNDNILVPQPGFSLYVTLCQSLGIEPRYYKLKPNQNWEVDLDDLEAAIDKNTKAVIVNNPSNPCGSVYNAEHLRKIIEVCEKHCLPIIADEIYADMVFPGNKFCFMGPLSEKVPILSCGGLAKRYICPGWRFGWIAMYDRDDRLLESIRPGLLDLSSRILGPNSVMQSALPDILSNTPQQYFDDIMSQIQNNADICCQILANAPGLKPIMPQGTMYILVEIDNTAFSDVDDDTVFFSKLFNEQSVSCLPASVFGVPNFFRLILTAPAETTREACERIVEFCLEHEKIVGARTLGNMKSHTWAETGVEGLA